MTGKENNCCKPKAVAQPEVKPVLKTEIKAKPVETKINRAKVDNK
jgi:hypothetical protein